MRIFAIFDCAAKRFLAPLHLIEDDVTAFRTFRSFLFQLVVDRQSVIDGVKPTEFALYDLGEVDLHTGVIDPGMVTRVCDAMSVLSDPDFKAIVAEFTMSEDVSDENKT